MEARGGQADDEVAEGRIPIAIVDDYPVMLEGLKSVLEQHGYHVVVSACNGEDYIRKSKSLRAELALVDLQMPGMDGWATIGWMRQHQPWVRVLAHTDDADAMGVMRAMRAGACGVLLKDRPCEELTGALSDIRERRFHLNALTERYLRMPNVVSRPSPPKPHEQLAALSARERELFDLAVSKPECTYDDFASRMNISIHTVETYRRSMMDKLGLKDRTDLVRFALRNGF